MRTRIAYIGSLLVLAVVVVAGILRTEVRRNDAGNTVRHTVREVQLLEHPDHWVLQINLTNDLQEDATYSIFMTYEGATQSSNFWIRQGGRAIFTRQLPRSGQVDVAMVAGPDQKELDRFTLQIPAASARPVEEAPAEDGNRWRIFGSVGRWFS